MNFLALFLLIMYQLKKKFVQKRFAYVKTFTLIQFLTAVEDSGQKSFWDASPKSVSTTTLTSRRCRWSRRRHWRCCWSAFRSFFRCSCQSFGRKGRTATTGKKISSTFRTSGLFRTTLNATSSVSATDEIAATVTQVLPTWTVMQESGVTQSVTSCVTPTLTRWRSRFLAKRQG